MICLSKLIFLNKQKLIITLIRKEKQREKNSNTKRNRATKT